MNASKIFRFGRHDLTVYGTGYYGFAYQPGLIPIDTYVPGDTIDSRQSEETASGALILNDIWHVTAHSHGFSSPRPTAITRWMSARISATA